MTYDRQLTALLVIAPYNDFISEGGKVWDRLKSVADANKCIPHMMQVLDAARKAELRVFYALHHDADLVWSDPHASAGKCEVPNLTFALSNPR